MGVDPPAFARGNKSEAAHAAVGEGSRGASASHSLAVALGPALIEECRGKLSDIEWFHSTWQRGGAATGFAKWRRDSGEEIDVVVKLPVGPVEHHWTTRLGEVPESEWSSEAALALPTPRVLAAGHSIGGYDLAWVIIERLDGHPLSGAWGRQSLEDLLRAAAAVQGLAVRAMPVTEPSPEPDWEKEIGKAREIARGGDVPESQRWNEAVHRVQRVLPRLTAKWASRGVDSWCHGDLHPGNAMRRRPENGTPVRGCVIFDMAFMHAGHWVEDAVYLERQFWSHPEHLHGAHTVSLLARYRRELGLQTTGDYGAVANLRRVLMAACVPAHLAHEGSPRYVHAALDMLERLLPQVGG